MNINECRMDDYTETLNDFTAEELEEFEKQKENNLIQKNKWRFNDGKI